MDNSGFVVWSFESLFQWYSQPTPDMLQLIWTRSLVKKGSNHGCFSMVGFGVLSKSHRGKHEKVLTTFKQKLPWVMSAFYSLLSKNKLTDSCCSQYLTIYIYTFSRCFYPKWLTVHSGYICIVSMTTVKKSRQEAVNAEMSSCTLIQVNTVSSLNCILMCL